MRLLRHEHRRQKRSRVHQRLRGREEGHQDLSAAAHASHQGSGPGSHQFLCSIRLDQTLAADPNACAAGWGAAAVEGGSGKGGSPLGVHTVRLLLDELPQLLVEQRALLGAGRAVGRLPLDRGQPRRGHRGAPRSARGSLPPVSLPYHHELHRGVPKGFESRESHCRDQAGYGTSPPLMLGEIGKLRWRCRRGMRELDVLLTRYVDEEYRTAAPEQQEAFRRLLDIQDPLMHAYFLGREAPPDAALASLIARITAAARNGR